MKNKKTLSNSSILSEAKRHSFTLGNWLVNKNENTIDDGNNCLTIEPKMMDVLVYLCQNAKQTISAEQLLIACWAGTFYGDAPVQKCIAGLRKKLGCNSRHPIYIETIHRRGYRIIADVRFSQDKQPFLEINNTNQWTKGSPYLGLNSFSQEHSSIYFGRTKATAEIIKNLKHCIESDFHFLLVLGKSGSGKSSLIKAGVLPYLNQKIGFTNLRVDKYQIISPSQSDYISPTATLIDALSSLSLLEPSMNLDELTQIVEKSPERLTSALISPTINANPLKSEKVKEYHLLVLDQFEQFLLDENLDERAKSKLIVCIEQLSRCKNLLVIAMLRNDFYAQCLDVPSFSVLKENGRQYDLQPATPYELEKMICNPALAAGLTFELDEQTGEQLDEVILNSAITNPNALPLIEYTLDQLYLRRDKNNQMLLSVYHEMGGVEGAIAQKAEKTFSSMPLNVQKCWDKIMHSLVKVETNNLHAITARKVPLSIFTCPNEQQFIQIFLSARLFVSIIRSPRGEHRLTYSGDNIEGNQNGAPIYEQQFITIAHEALLYHWDKVSLWVNENRTAIIQREQLAFDCQHWLDNKKSNDTLLNSKQKLRDGLWLTNRVAVNLNDNELAFINESKRYHSRVKYIKNIILFLMISFSVVIGFQSKQVSNERDTALQQSDRAEAISSFLTDMFANANPNRAKGKDILVKDILDKASEELISTDLHSLSSQPLVEASIQNVIGGIYLNLGLLDKSSKHLNRALKIYETVTDEQSKEYLSLLDNLVGLYSIKFEYEKVLPLMNEVITLSSKIYGVNDRRYLNYRSNLGSYYHNTGALNKAEEIFSDVYKKRKQFFGENDKETIQSVESLATLYYWLGDYNKSEDFLKICIEKNTSLLGSDHPYTLRCIGVLGSLYESMGNYNQAAPIISKHIQKATIVLGDKHPNVMRSMHNLADTYRGLGRFEESEALFRKTLALRQSVLGDDHIETLQTQMKLARLLRQNKRFEEAFALVNDTVAKQKIQLGAEHPTTLIATQELADLLRQQEKFNDALALYLQVLESREKVLSKNHPDLKETLLGLINIYLIKDDALKAEQYFEQIFSLAESNRTLFKKEIQSILTLLINYFSQKDSPKKVNYYQDKLQVYQNSL